MTTPAPAPHSIAPTDGACKRVLRRTSWLLLGTFSAACCGAGLASHVHWYDGSPALATAGTYAHAGFALASGALIALHGVLSEQRRRTVHVVVAPVVAVAAALIVGFVTGMLGTVLGLGLF